MMKKRPLKQLAALGTSIWLDYIRRKLIVGGELERLIEEDGLRGMTSNPAIFEKAIGESQNYDEDIRAMSFAGKSVMAIYETLSLGDVQSAADVFGTRLLPARNYHGRWADGRMAGPVRSRVLDASRSNITRVFYDERLVHVVYSIRVAQMVVYELLRLDREIPAISRHDKSAKVKFDAVLKAFA